MSIDAQIDCALVDTWNILLCQSTDGGKLHTLVQILIILFIVDFVNKLLYSVLSPHLMKGMGLCPRKVASTKRCVCAGRPPRIPESPAIWQSPRASCRQMSWSCKRLVTSPPARWVHLLTPTVNASSLVEIGASNGNPQCQNRRTARRPRLHDVRGVIFIFMCICLM